MILVAGHIVQLFEQDGTRMAKVQVSAALISVSVARTSEVRVGDSVLVDSGVAIAKIENRITEED